MTEDVAPENLVVLILAGGVGTRFWPVSTEEKPKQFLALIGPETLLQAAFRRARLLAPAERILVMTNETFVPLVLEQLPDIPRDNIVGEPMRRDTAAAICLGALLFRRRFGDPVMVVVTADHLITPDEEFVRVIRSAAAAAAAEPALYTIGIRPTYPATSYGYLRQGEVVRSDDGLNHYSVLEFKEKPDLATAEAYLRSGEYWWNSGMFVWRVDAIMAEVACHLPQHMEGLRAVVAAGAVGGGRQQALRDAFAALPAVSIDYGVMEQAAQVRMVGATFAWSDLGGWLALEEFLPADEAGNHYRGRLASLDARGNIVFSEEPDELVALVGVDDLVVVRAGKKTLVVARTRAEEVKQLVTRLGSDAGRRPEGRGSCG